MQQRLRMAGGLQAVVEAGLLRLQGNGERQLQAAELAGSLAWNVHPGRFALPAVERILREAPDLLGRGAAAGMARAVQGRTLHVLTEAYEVGGHTKLVQRWIELMDDDRHAVALVRQRNPMDAAWLVPGGREVPLLDLMGAGIRDRRDRAGHLVDLFRAARRVVLHIHPDDAVSVAAAYRTPGADIRFLNHADHVAWLGAGLPATWLNLRHGGTRLAAERRGIDAGACDVVPIPITAPQALDRAEARRRLGLGEGDVLMLTVASGYKYNAIEGRSLMPALDRALRRRNLRLMAIGPDAGHPLFAELAERHPGQVQALGPIPGPDLHRAAADLYLDSHPFCSPTSMLESAALGTPVLALQPEPAEMGILYCECPGLGREDYAAADPEGFEALLDRMTGDRAHREAVSGALREGMAVHFPEAWRASLAAHMDRRLGRDGWEGGGIPTLEGPLDRVLAGLGKDPAVYAKLSRFRALGLRGQFDFLSGRLRGRH